MQELDLSCCHQIACHHLIAAAAQVAAIPKSTTPKAMFSLENEAWPDFPELIRMENLNLSHCWRVDHKNLLRWLKLVCPNLLELRRKHCGHPLQIILEIGSSLPNLLALDLSEPEELVVTVGAVTRMNAICSNYKLQTTRHFDYDYILWDPRKQYVPNRLRELSLRGRSELTGC